MELLASQLAELAIVSLQSNESPGHVIRPVVLTANLQVVALLCQLYGAKSPQIIRIQDIRQVSPDCLLINDESDIVAATDLVRLQPIIAADYNPIGQKVATESGQTLGLVADYSIEPSTSMITSLTLRPKLFSPRLTRQARISREQIVDISPRQITVRDLNVTANNLSATPVPDPSA